MRKYKINIADYPSKQVILECIYEINQGLSFFNPHKQIEVYGDFIEIHPYDIWGFFDLIKFQEDFSFFERKRLYKALKIELLYHMQFLTTYEPLVKEIYDSLVIYQEC